MVAAVCVLRPLLGPRVLGPAYGLVLLYVFDLASQFLTTTPVLEQIFVIASKGATGALLLWAAARLSEEGALSWRSPRSRRVGHRTLRLLAFGCLAAAAAAALGYVELADFLGGGAIFLVYSAFVVLAFRVAANGVVAIGLVRGPLARLRTVEHHRATIERALARSIDVFALGFWLFLALSRFELLDPARAALATALAARLQIGALDLAVGRMLGFAAVVFLAWLVSRTTVALLEEDVYLRMALPRGVPYALTTLTRYALLLAGFLLALATLGLDLTSITVLVSAFGVGLGFGLQQVVSNFVSGLILLFERPVHVGDSVQLGDLAGEVARIGIRSSTIRTPAGAEVMVPNSKLIDEKITNWTLSDRKRRVDLELPGIDTDPERVLELLIDVARRDPRVSAEPLPEALVVRFAKDAADFQLRFWTEESEWMRLRSEIGVAIQRALRADPEAPQASQEAASAGSRPT